MRVVCRCIGRVIVIATRVGTRVRWVVCLYGVVGTCEVDDAVTHDKCIICKLMLIRVILPFTNNCEEFIGPFNVGKVSIVSCSTKIRH